MNMEMLLMVMALGSSSSGGSSAGLTDTLLYTSDMLPQMPRMLLAMNSAKATNDRHARAIATLAGQVYNALKRVIGSDLSKRLKLVADLGSSPDLVAALRANLTATQFGEIVNEAA